MKDNKLREAIEAVEMYADCFAVDLTDEKPDDDKVTIKFKKRKTCAELRTKGAERSRRIPLA